MDIFWDVWKSKRKSQQYCTAQKWHWRSPSRGAHLASVENWHDLFMHDENKMFRMFYSTAVHKQAGHRHVRRFYVSLSHQGDALKCSCNNVIIRIVMLLVAYETEKTLGLYIHT